MKAERVELKSEFVPVVVTLESQEEVDALFAVTNHAKIVDDMLPVMAGWWSKLERFKSPGSSRMWNKLNIAIR